MVTWKVYYGDGSSFSDEDGAAADAPVMDVQVIAQAAGCDIGRHLISRHDFYWFEPGEWFGGDQWGLFDYLLRSQGRSVVKFGRYVTRVAFDAALLQAANDLDLPKKIAWLPTERH